MAAYRGRRRAGRARPVAKATKAMPASPVAKHRRLIWSRKLLSHGLRTTTQFFPFTTLSPRSSRRYLSDMNKKRKGKEKVMTRARKRAGRKDDRIASPAASPRPPPRSDHAP